MSSGSAPSMPSSTSVQQTTVMDPKLYKLLYGSKNAPGSTLLSNAARRATMLDQAQQGDPEALAKVFGHKNFQDYYPPAQVPTAERPYQSSTPGAIAAAAPDVPAETQGLYKGGPISSFALVALKLPHDFHRMRLVVLVESATLA